MTTTKDTPMDTPIPKAKAIPKVRVTIWHDHHMGAPQDEYDTLFRLISFGRNHMHSESPDDVLWLDGDTDTPNPDIVATLSYYEHGLCRWSRQGSGPPDYGGFDTVDFAGVLVWHKSVTPDEHVWFGEKPETERNAMIDSFLDEYTSWVNGNTHGFTLSLISHCESCGHEVRDSLDMPSVGGMIGGTEAAYQVRQHLQYELSDLPADTEVEYVGSDGPVPYEVEQLPTTLGEFAEDSDA